MNRKTKIVVEALYKTLFISIVTIGLTTFLFMIWGPKEYDVLLVKISLTLLVPFILMWRIGEYIRDQTKKGIW